MAAVWPGRQQARMLLVRFWALVLAAAWAAPPEALVEPSPPQSQEQWDCLVQQLNAKRLKIESLIDDDLENERHQIWGLLTEITPVVAALQGSPLLLCEELNCVTDLLRPLNRNLQSLCVQLSDQAIATIWPLGFPEEDPTDYLESFAALHTLWHLKMETEVAWYWLETPRRGPPFDHGEGHLERVGKVHRAAGNLLWAAARLAVLDAASYPAAAEGAMDVSRLGRLSRPLLQQRLSEACEAYANYIDTLVLMSPHELRMNDWTLRMSLRGIGISARLLGTLNRLAAQATAIVEGDSWEEGGQRGPGRDFLLLVGNFAANIANDLVCGQQAEAAVLAFRTNLSIFPPSRVPSLNYMPAVRDGQYEGLASDLENFALLKQLVHDAHDLAYDAAAGNDWIAAMIRLAVIGDHWHSNIFHHPRIKRILKNKRILDECFCTISKMRNVKDRRYYFSVYAEQGFALLLYGRIIGAGESVICRLAVLLTSFRKGAESVPEPVELEETVTLASKRKRAQ